MDWVEDVKNRLEKYKINDLKCKEKGYFKRKGEIHERGYILAKKDIVYNFQLKKCKYEDIVKVDKDGKLKIREIENKKYNLTSEGNNLNNDYCLHLNSSQAMCVNFFHRLLKVYEDEELLKKIINRAFNKKVLTDIQIDEYGFEYKEYKVRQKEKEFYKGEGTSFDFYVKTKSKKEFFWEIKYTENNDKYPNKYKKNEKGYKHKFDHEPYNDIIEEAKKINKSYWENIKKYGYDKFYEFFQVNRCISYVRDKNDYCIFVVPKQNEKIYGDFYDKINTLNNVALISCEDIINLMKEHLKERPDEKNFYEGFKEKYFPEEK